MKKYYAEECLSLNLPKNIKDELKDNLGKRVFYGDSEKCKYGRLIGIYMLSTPFYILDVEGYEQYIPCAYSLTKF